ncbi:hypothetical protein DL767_006675 [Monosporascus sp. MG133]|nr:hypothetical protein DL767_006675 [Monosporascus sp. MG133]
MTPSTSGASNREIFRIFGVPETTGRRWVKKEAPDILPQGEKRGRKRKFDETQVELVDHFYHHTSHPWSDHRLGWQDLAKKAGANPQCSTSTIKRALKPLGIHTRPETKKPRLNDSTKKQRIERAQRELKGGYWEDPDFLARLVSEDEIHFGFKKEGRSNVRRKAEDHNAWWTVSESNATMDRGQRRQEERLQQQLHYDPPLEHHEQKACQAVGLMAANGWRSPLFWYEVKDPRGKMNSLKYIEIMEWAMALAELWLGRKDLIIWQDGDSSHTSKVTKEWLQRKGYTAIYNVHDSPETNPIESTIKKVKSHITNNPHINTQELVRLAEEGWDMMDKGRQKAIFKSMVQRWKDFIKGGGQRIAH